MKQVPNRILAELKRYDPALRLRWSREKRKFVLERKVLSGLRKYVIPEPIRWTETSIVGVFVKKNLDLFSERYIAWHEGYVPILEVGKLDRRLFWKVFELDAWRFGRYGKRYHNHAQFKEAQKEENEMRRFRGRIEDRAKESYENIAWRTGRRTFHSFKDNKAA